jgi:hypothetical protein
MSELVKLVWTHLPYNIVLYILQYDRRFVIKNGKIIVINKIPIEDYRYNLLNTSFTYNPLVIKQVLPNQDKNDKIVRIMKCEIIFENHRFV